MSKNLPENTGFESGKVTPEELVAAIKLVGEFAKNDPEGALKIVRASLATKTRQGNDTTSA